MRRQQRAFRRRLTAALWSLLRLRLEVGRQWPARRWLRRGLLGRLLLLGPEQQISQRNYNHQHRCGSDADIAPDFGLKFLDGLGREGRDLALFKGDVEIYSGLRDELTQRLLGIQAHGLGILPYETFPNESAGKVRAAAGLNGLQVSQRNARLDGQFVKAQSALLAGAAQTLGDIARRAC